MPPPYTLRPDVIEVNSATYSTTEATAQGRIVNINVPCTVTLGELGGSNEFAGYFLRLNNASNSLVINRSATNTFNIDGSGGVVSITSDATKTKTGHYFRWESNGSGNVSNFHEYTDGVSGTYTTA